MKFLHALFFATSLSATAQPYQVPQVPNKIIFAGITLTIRHDAQKEIQKDVNALWQSPKHFNLKAERAKTYFPIIEKIFAEERVPDDFKYLVLQESALIADAVSVSNAVGFWQFKDFTAMEMGLRVDDVVDERMNIFSATRGAAKYIKRNNYQFNNWVYALQAYQMGAGGVARSVKDVESGARHMTITSNTYWYVKKFLAHKIAFENAVVGKPQQPVITYENRKQQSVEDAANSLSLPVDELLSYNKWIRKGSIPEDRVYAVLVPLAENTKIPDVVKDSRVEAIAPVNNPLNKPIFINGVSAIQAAAGETLTALALRAGISLPLFMSYNDLAGFEKAIVNNYYFTERKKVKAEKEQVLAKTGDDLWSISQQYGVMLDKLKKYNRTDITILRAGQVVWLSSKMPKNQNTQLDNRPTVAVDEKFFHWGAQPGDTSTVLTSVQPQILPEITTQAQENIHVSISDSVTIENVKNTVTELPNYHIVQAGENLYAISKKYGLPVDNLTKWNNLGNNYNLAHGQQLNLYENQSVKKPVARVEIIHQVKPSDTLYGIAREYGITIKELMEWNNKKDFTLAAGEKLRILKE